MNANLDNESFPVGVQERVTVRGESFSFCTDEACSWTSQAWRIGYRLLRHGVPGIPFLLWPRGTTSPQDTVGWWYRCLVQESGGLYDLETTQTAIRYRVLDYDLPPSACEFAFMPCGAPQPFLEQRKLWVLQAGEITREVQRDAAREHKPLGAYGDQLRGTNYRLNRWYAGLYTWALYLSGNYVRGPGQEFEGVDAAHGYEFEIDGVRVNTIGAEGRRDGMLDYRFLCAAEEFGEKAQSLLAALRSKVSRHIPETRGYHWNVPDTYDPMPGFDFDAMRIRLAEFLTTGV